MRFIKKMIKAIIFRIFCLFEFVFFNIRFIYMKIRYYKQYQKLKRFKDIHKGERCFLIGTGPSLTDEDLLKLGNEYTFGVNSIIWAGKKLNFYPNYYCEMNYYEPDWNEIIDNNKSIIFFTHRKDMKREKYLEISRKKNAYEFLMLEDGNWINFSKKIPMKFSFDITKNVGWGYTVVYSVYQLIAYMGFSEIYLLGMDCSYPKDSAYYDNQHRTEKEIDEVVKLGNTVSQYIEAHNFARLALNKLGVKVFNATRGGQLEVFPRVNLDTILK